MNCELFDTLLIFCPPLSKYPQQPKDMSKCTLEPCPKCNKEMWLSEKKKELIKDKKDMELILSCYDCFIEFAQDKKNKHILENHIKIDL
jgi:hypothetical protein